MSIVETNFSSVAYGNGTTLWLYNTPDTIADLSSHNYFSIVSDSVRRGDIIFANTNIDTAITLAVFTVTAVSSGNVTVSVNVNPFS